MAFCGICHKTSNDTFYNRDTYMNLCKSCYETQVKTCRYCVRKVAFSQKFKNIDVYLCGSHYNVLRKIPLRIGETVNKYRCEHCTKEVFYKDLYCCESCQNDIMCKECVYSKTRRAFNPAGVVICSKCEPEDRRKEYEKLWKFQRDYVNVMMSRWDDTILKYVKPFINYKM